MLEPKISTIYYQGMTSSQTQLAKYTGTKGFLASTGEWVVCPKAIDVINNPFVGKEIQEVNLKPLDNVWNWLNPIDWLLISKSLIANYWSGIRITQATIQAKAQALDEGSVAYHSIRLSMVNVGQQQDIDSHAQKYCHWNDQREIDEKAVLFGVSRGAATTFSAIAQYHYPNVKLVILEGCFYNVSDVMQRRYGYLAGLAEHALSKLNYDPNGISPSSNIIHFPKDIPVAFISSKCDKEVPYASTYKLANELAKTRQAPVYLLTLYNSSHPNYMFDDAHDRASYEKFIHALYKKYQLPHQPELAVAGKSLLKASLIKK